MIMVQHPIYAVVRLLFYKDMMLLYFRAYCRFQGLLTTERVVCMHPDIDQQTLSVMEFLNMFE